MLCIFPFFIFFICILPRTSCTTWIILNTVIIIKCLTKLASNCRTFYLRCHRRYSADVFFAGKKFSQNCNKTLYVYAPYLAAATDGREWLIRLQTYLDGMYRLLQQAIAAKMIRSSFLRATDLPEIASDFFLKQNAAPIYCKCFPSYVLWCVYRLNIYVLGLSGAHAYQRC